MSRVRYLIDNYGPDDHTMELAFKTCAFLARDASREIWIVVNCRHSMSENNSILEILGKDKHYDLFNAGITEWQDATFRIVEIDSISDPEQISIVMAAFCSPDTLRIIETWPNVRTVVAFAWIREDTENWERRYNPRLIDRQHPPFEPIP